jgi:hypothetical protein
MAKDKTGKAPKAEAAPEKTKAPKAAKGKADDEFAKPSEAEGGGDGWNMTEEAEGRLLLITPLRQIEAETKDYGAKPVIVATVVVIDEKKPAKSELHEEVYIWGGYLRGALKSFIGERRVLARLVRGTKKERGNYPWLFEDADDDEVESARAYLATVDPFDVPGGKGKSKSK